MSITLHVKAADLVHNSAKVNFERQQEEDTDGTYAYAIALVVFPSGLELGFDCSDDLTSLHTDVKPASKRRQYIDALCELGVPFTVS